MIWSIFKRNRDGKTATKKAAQPSASSNLSGPKPPPASPQSGYDPYNSGAFKKRDSWEKVTRK